MWSQWTSFLHSLMPSTKSLKSFVKELTLPIVFLSRDNKYARLTWDCLPSMVRQQWNIVNLNRITFAWRVTWTFHLPSFNTHSWHFYCKASNKSKEMFFNLWMVWKFNGTCFTSSNPCVMYLHLIVWFQFHLVVKFHNICKKLVPFQLI